MLSVFYPDEYLDSAYEINFESFYERGMRGVIFDIDNTLVPHDAPADGRAKELFERLHKLGFSTMLLSNNKEPRVKSFAEEVRTAFLYKAGKPKRGGYRLAMERMGTAEGSTLFVGDQLFTDVWGAKRSGIWNGSCCIFTRGREKEDEGDQYKNKGVRPDRLSGGAFGISGHSQQSG